MNTVNAIATDAAVKGVNKQPADNPATTAQQRNAPR